MTSAILLTANGNVNIDSAIIAAWVAAAASVLIFILDIVFKILSRSWDKKDREKEAEENNNRFNITLKEENQRLERSVQEQFKLNQSNLSAQYITDKRVQWIGDLRNAMADYAAYSTLAREAAVVARENETPINGEYPEVYEINLAAYKIKLLLNVMGETDKEIEKLLNNTTALLVKVQNSEGNANTFDESLDQLIKEMRGYLKAEWERVKQEIKEND